MSIWESVHIATRNYPYPLISWVELKRRGLHLIMSIPVSMVDRIIWRISLLLVILVIVESLTYP
jgi:hypothetical protein